MKEGRTKDATAIGRQREREIVASTNRKNSEQNHDGNRNGKTKREAYEKHAKKQRLLCSVPIMGGWIHASMHACMYPCGDGCIHQPLLLVSDGEKRSHQTMTTKTTKTHTRTHTWLAGDSVSRIFVRRSMKGVLWMKFSFFAVVLKQFVPRVLSALSGGRSSLSSDFQHCGSSGPLRNRCCVGDVRRICL